MSLRLSLPLAALSLLAPAALPAQEPAAKAAPQVLVVTTTVPQARAAFAAGATELMNGRFDRADREFRHALELDPGAGVVRASYAAWAIGLAQPERLREADRAVVDAARASTPELLTAAALREWVRRDPAAWGTLIRATRALVPDDPYLAALEAGGALMSGKPADVVGIAQEYLARNPNAAAMYNLLGYALFRTGRQADGLAAMERYLALLPDQPNPHDSYGELLLASGRQDDAEREYRRAIELDPGFTNSYRGLARVAQLRHDYRAARSPLEAVVAQAPTLEARADAQRDLAFNAVFLGDMDAARDQLMAAAVNAEKGGLAVHAAFSHGYLAVLEAAAGHARAAREQLAARGAAPAWNRAVGSALAHGALGRATEVANDLAALEQAARDTPGIAPDALPLARLIDCAVRGDVDGASAELAGMKAANFRLLGQAFVMRAARRAKDAPAMDAAQAELSAYKPVDGNSAFAHRLVRLP
jgi:tetratricopeptide (TPR) repeat protein